MRFFLVGKKKYPKFFHSLFSFSTEVVKEEKLLENETVPWRKIGLPDLITRSKCEKKTFII